MARARLPHSEFCSVACEDAFGTWVEAQEQYHDEHTEVVSEPRKVKRVWRPFQIDTPHRNVAPNGHARGEVGNEPRVNVRQNGGLPPTERATGRPDT